MFPIDAPPPNNPSHDEWATVPAPPSSGEGNWSTVDPGSADGLEALDGWSTACSDGGAQKSAASFKLELRDYEILGELGRGGMGVLYRARHLPTGEMVALKTLQQLTTNTLYRFKQEFRVVAGLVHPNLISLRELDRQVSAPEYKERSKPIRHPANPSRTVVASLPPRPWELLHRPNQNNVAIPRDQTETRLTSNPQLTEDHFSNRFLEAGDKAAAATAFDRSARLYRLAAEFGIFPTEDWARLRAKEADALANAGRGADAAEAYLAAAALVVGETGLIWRRQAAEQYLITGHFDVGLRLLKDVVAATELYFPATPFWAILGLLWGRLRLRGLDFRSRPLEVVPKSHLRRIDVCWVANIGLSFTDTIRSAYFQTHGLLQALRAGEPRRVVRFLALDAVHAAIRGPSAHERARFLLDTADVIAVGISEPYPCGIVSLARGMCEFLAGRFGRGADLLRSAEETFRDSCTRVTWEIDTSRTWWLLSHIFLGKWADLEKAWSALLRDAQNRGDLYAEVYLSTFILATVRLAADEPDRALREVKAAMIRWSPSGFHVQHHNELVATVLIRLYQGDGAAAWEAIRDKQRLYQKVMMWQIQQVRTDFLQLRACSALLASRQSADSHRLIRAAESDVRALERESAAWSQALGCLMRVCLNETLNGANEANAFATAATRLEAADLGAFAAAARYRQGERTGGDEGKHLQNDAVAWLVAQGVRDPLRMIRSHAPTKET